MSEARDANAAAAAGHDEGGTSASAPVARPQFFLAPPPRKCTLGATASSLQASPVPEALGNKSAKSSTASTFRSGQWTPKAGQTTDLSARGWYRGRKIYGWTVLSSMGTTGKEKAGKQFSVEVQCFCGETRKYRRTADLDNKRGAPGRLPCCRGRPAAPPLDDEGGNDGDGADDGGDDANGDEVDGGDDDNDDDHDDDSHDGYDDDDGGDDGDELADITWRDVADDWFDRRLLIAAFCHRARWIRVDELVAAFARECRQALLDHGVSDAVLQRAAGAAPAACDGTGARGAAALAAFRANVPRACGVDLARHGGELLAKCVFGEGAADDDDDDDKPLLARGLSEDDESAQEGDEVARQWAKRAADDEDDEVALRAIAQINDDLVARRGLRLALVERADVQAWHRTAWERMPTARARVGGEGAGATIARAAMNVLHFEGDKREHELGNKALAAACGQFDGWNDAGVVRTLALLLPASDGAEQTDAAAGSEVEVVSVCSFLVHRGRNADAAAPASSSAAAASAGAPVVVLELAALKTRTPARGCGAARLLIAAVKAVAGALGGARALVVGAASTKAQNFYRKENFKLGTRDLEKEGFERELQAVNSKLVFALTRHDGAAAAQHSVCWHAALDGGVSVRGGIDFICCDPERLHSALTDTVTAHDTAEAGIGQSDSEMSEADAHIIQRVAPIASDGGEAHDAAADEDDVDDDAPLLKGDESPAATLKNAFDVDDEFARRALDVADGDVHMAGEFIEDQLSVEKAEADRKRKAAKELERLGAVNPPGVRTLGGGAPRQNALRAVAKPDAAVLARVKRQLRELKYSPSPDAPPRQLLRALPVGSPGPEQNELENALIHVLELVEVAHGPPRVVHGHGLVARRDLKPGESFSDPLVVTWARCRDAERGREISSLVDLESERVLKSDGYKNSGWSLRDLDDEDSYRRDRSGPCSLLFFLNESPAHRAREADKAGNAEEAALMRKQAERLPHAGEPNVQWRPDTATKRILVYVTREIKAGDELLGKYWSGAASRARADAPAGAAGSAPVPALPLPPPPPEAAADRPAPKRARLSPPVPAPSSTPARVLPPPAPPVQTVTTSRSFASSLDAFVEYLRGQGHEEAAAAQMRELVWRFWHVPEEFPDLFFNGAPCFRWREWGRVGSFLSVLAQGRSPSTEAALAQWSEFLKLHPPI